MARLATWIVLVVAAGVVVGCGPAKELPDEVPRTTEPTEKPLAVPAASEPAAKALADRALQASPAASRNRPRSGKRPAGRFAGRARSAPTRPIETVQTEAAVWPDRYAAVVDMQLFGARSILRTWLLRPNLTVMNGEQEQSLPNAAQSERELTADVTAQLWLPLLVPLTDPKAVVFDSRSPPSDSNRSRY